MTVKVEWNAIGLKDAPDYSKFAQIEVKKAFKAEAKIVKRMFERTTKTWSDKPKFERKIKISPRFFSLKVFTDSNVYFYLVKGTKIRWAIMSSDFQGKSYKRVLGSRPGRGGAVIVGKKAMQARNIPPQPGIEATEWDLEIRERREDKLRRNLVRAMFNAKKRAEKEARKQS